MKRPLRFMQTHTFLGSYVQQFYGRHPEMLHENSARQNQALIRDAFSAVHMFAPYTEALGCEFWLVLSDVTPMQVAWANENKVGARVEYWEQDILRAQIAHFQPDVLLMGNPIRFSAAFIASLTYKPPVIMGWRAADVPFGTDWTGFDVMLSGLPRLLALAESLGAGKGVFFQPGMPSWIAREVEDIPQDVDVVFAGSVNPTQHVRRWALLEKLAEAATKHGFSLSLCLGCDPALVSPVMRPYVHPAVFGLEMHRTLRRGKIVFDTRGSIGLRKPDGSYAMDLAQAETVNMRLFEATGGGSLLLTDALSGLARYFEPGKEAATFLDEQDLEDKILYYLEHNEEREAMAAAGKARCLSEWNMKNRARQLIDIAKEVLAAKGLDANL